jgi:site-specific DNA-methyltransferase (adenine-specific)
MKFEIEPLVAEMLNQLPDSVWSSKTSTFFDPAIGGGQFVRAIEQRLRSAGHSDANIRSRVMGFEESDLHIRFAVNKYKLVGQYVRKPYEKFFELDNTMKFDVVIGNPPYNIGLEQHRYIDFIKQTENLTKGESAYIIPIAWTYSPRFKNFLSFLKDNGLYKIEFLTRDEFPGIIQDVCKIFLKKGYVKDILVMSKTKTVSSFSRDAISLLPASNTIAERIFEAVGKCAGLELSGSDNKTVRHHGDKDFNDYISEVKTKTHKIKLLSRLGGASANNEIFWVSTASNIDNTFKVATARLQPSTGRVSYWQVVDPSFAISESLVFLKFDSKTKAENCKLFLESSLVKFLFKELMQTARMSKNLISKIPSLDFTKKWTDETIYQHFNLTQEEIEYVEANVK